MARYRYLARKLRYAKEMNTNSPVPSWIVMKTRRTVRNNPQRRRWRQVKLKR